jgi:hypothetical protein
VNTGSALNIRIYVRSSAVNCFSGVMGRGLSRQARSA